MAWLSCPASIVAWEASETESSVLSLHACLSRDTSEFTSIYGRLNLSTQAYNSKKLFMLSKRTAIWGSNMAQAGPRTSAEGILTGGG